MKVKGSIGYLFVVLLTIGVFVLPVELESGCSRPGKGDYLSLLEDRLKLYPNVVKTLPSLGLGRYLDAEHGVSMIMPKKWNIVKAKDWNVMYENGEGRSYVTIGYRIHAESRTRRDPESFALMLKKKLDDEFDKKTTKDTGIESVQIIQAPVVYSLGEYMVGGYTAKYLMKDGRTLFKIKKMIDDGDLVYDISGMAYYDTQRYSLVRFLVESAAMTFWSTSLCTEEEK